MSSLELACPRCGAKLKLPDRSLLGKKGKCKKCDHRFIMVEPEPPPVQFEAAHEPDDADKTMVGEFVKWVPEETSQFDFAPASPVIAPQPPAPVFTPPPAVPPLLTDPTPVPPALIRARKRKGNGVVMACAIAAVLACGAAFAWFGGYLDAGKAEKPVAKKSRAVDDVEEKKPTSRRVVSSSGDEEPRAPLNLMLLPDGVEIIVHLRPAALWADTPTAKEFRYALGPLAKWLEDEEQKTGAIRSLCFQEPKQLEELLIGFVPETYPTPPSVCFVARTVKPVKQSDLIDQFQGDLEELGPKEVYVNDTWAYVIKDQKTYAGCPVALKTMMIENIDRPILPRDALVPVLAACDRNRPITIAAITDTLYQHQETVVPANVRPAMVAFLDWCSSNARSFAWSMQLDDEELVSEILIGVDRTQSVRRVTADFEKRLETTPRDILDLVLHTHPETVGMRNLVGRFPAMMKAYAMSTAVEEGRGHVALKTYLPQRAAPNLAAAGLFTWDLTNRPSFGTAQPESSGPGEGDPSLTIAQRLQSKIPEVDFRDDMMYACFDFIGDDIGVKFKLEGDDLKAAGVTQNMKQKFKMENAPATVVIDKIVGSLGLCIVVNEEERIVHVTSLKAATERGWKPFPLK